MNDASHRQRRASTSARWRSTSPCFASSASTWDSPARRKDAAAGECGACTVFLDGHTVNSCLVLAAEADGSTMRTIEGEAQDGKLSALQKAFARHHAVQCGYCTAGWSCRRASF